MEQSIAPPNKQIRIKTPKKINGRGLLNPPPSRAMSLSIHGQNQQPPLLPLPHASAIHHHQSLLSRSHSSQGLSRKRDMSLTPKKSKPTKREEAKKRSGTQSISEFLVSASDNRLGPDPKDLPKHLPVGLTSKVVLPGSGGNMEDMFSGSVFNLAPPPSSLPLPKFSLRSKLSCNAEAAAGSVDAGATNNLRRLLRLR
ncbi:hypothetical protein SESBI_13561 [Sesbania bispinosa]|nr:hypothetical protein SESBI_13561 [Sesbania bispinosa]